MEVGQIAGRADPKYGAATEGAIGARPAFRGRPVEIAVAALRKYCIWIKPIAARPHAVAECMQIRETAARTDAIHDPDMVCPAICGRSIEITVAALDQPFIGIDSIAFGRAEAVKIRQITTRTDPKHGAIVGRPA